MSTAASALKEAQSVKCGSKGSGGSGGGGSSEDEDEEEEEEDDESNSPAVANVDSSSKALIARRIRG